jgi:hypothetical protein
MLEVVGLVGLLFVLVIQVLELLFQLDCGGTLQAAFILIPLFWALDYSRLRQSPEVPFLREQRPPLPPEKFYWPVKRGSYWKQIVLLFSLSVGFWIFAVEFPARLDLSLESRLGWLAAFGAIGGTARLLSISSLYVKASQEMDRFTPNFVGLSRRVMYGLTDNREYLGKDR